MKPKRFNHYFCPLNKWDGGSKKSVSGRYCRNNCSEYRKGGCLLFNKVNKPL